MANQIDTLNAVGTSAPIQIQSRQTIVRPTNNVTKISHVDSVFCGYTENDNNNIYVVNQQRILSDIKNIRIQSAPIDTITIIESNPVSLNTQMRAQSVLAADSTWLLSITAIVALIVGFIRIRSMLFISSLLLSTLSEHNLKNVFNTLPTQNYWPYRLLHIVYFIVISIFIYEILTILGLHEIGNFKNFWLFVMILSAVIIFHIAKYLLNKMIGYAFNSYDNYNSIIQSKIIACELTSIFILPISMIFPFIMPSGYNVLMIIAFVFIGYFYLWRILKSIKIFLQNYVSAFYTILYLCIVEIIPIVCLYKIVCDLVI